jgi:hypothetical protein
MEDEKPADEVEVTEVETPVIQQNEDARYAALEERVKALEALFSDEVLADLLESIREIRAEETRPRTKSWLYRGRED